MTTNGTYYEQSEVVVLVRNSLLGCVKPERIGMGECRSYLPVVLDGKKTQPICRIYFMTEKMFIGTINTRRVETRYPISCLPEISKYGKDFEIVVRKYLDCCDP